MRCTPMRETVLYVDLDRLAENTRQVRKWIGPNVTFLAVVKGDGYGHGAPEIAPTLLKNGADMLGVACVSEGVALRKSGISAPICLLGYTPPALMPLAAEHQLTLAAVSLEQGRAISALGERLGTRLPVNVALDTGMHRVGIQDTEEGRRELLEVLTLPGLKPVGIFSHFAQASDEADRAQYARYENLLSAVRAAKLPVPVRHICESVATVSFPEYHLDMVRVGTLLYGTRSYPELPLKPVATFRSEIGSIRIIPPGEGVGYGYTWTARRTTVLGTLPFGFADGFSAQLAGIGTVMIRGKNVPLVGKICMDQCMVDLTDLPEAAVGDEVLIFGDGSHGENTVAGLCEKMGVTRGEVLCRITQRVPRVYLKQGSAAACRDLTAK